VADTPDPKWGGAGYRQAWYVGTLFLMHPVYSRQLRGSRYVVCPGTGELLDHLASQEDVKMPVCGKEDGGSVVAQSQDVMVLGYALKVGQLTYDCRYSTIHGMPVTGGRGFRGLKPLWYNGVPP